MLIVSTANPCPEDTACFGRGSCHVDDGSFNANCSCDDTYEGDDCGTQYCAGSDSYCYNGGSCP